MEKYIITIQKVFGSGVGAVSFRPHRGQVVGSTDAIATLRADSCDFQEAV